MKKLFLILLCTAALLAIACTVVNHTPVTICHATSSPTNPFTNPTVDESSIIGGSGHDSHGGDIIPAFTYYTSEVVGHEYRYKFFGHWTNWESGSCQWWMPNCQQRDVMGEVSHQYPGKNLTTLYGWGATGAEVLANGCVVPPPPYETCDETIVGTTVDVGDPVWGDWTFNQALGIMERFGTQATNTPLLDARDQTTVCGGTPGSRDVYESEKYEYCVTTNMTAGEWSEEIWDADAGAYYKTRTLTYTDALDDEYVCKTETERSDRPVATCVFDNTLPIDSGAEKDLYWQVTFTKEGQPPCYLVTWQRGEDGKFINPAVRSQLCNCGFVADNAPYGGWVTKDCYGNYHYHGQLWGFFQPRLLEPNWSGTCAMGC